MTPHGRVIEVIEQRAFAKAIERADNIRMLLDHDQNRVLASTQANTLEVKEDAVGLRAESVVTDPEVIEGAKAGRLRGWSFNIKNPKDTIEQRADGLPIRHITDLDMDEITLAMNRIPVYSSTSIEVRADTEDGEAVELRSEIPESIDFVDKSETRTEPEPGPTEPEPAPAPEPEPKPQYHDGYNKIIAALK